MRLINLASIRRLQSAGGVLTYPMREGAEKLFEADVPDELLLEWKAYADSKKRFNDILSKYNIEGV